MPEALYELGMSDWLVSVLLAEQTLNGRSEVE